MNFWIITVAVLMCYSIIVGILIDNIYNMMILVGPIFIIMAISSFVFVYYTEKDGYHDINYKIEKLEEICLNNEKGLLYTGMCNNKIECIKSGNIIAYRDSFSLKKIQAVYFMPYKYQTKCNKDDSKAIINMLSGMKKDFTILIK